MLNSTNMFDNKSELPRWLKYDERDFRVFSIMSIMLKCRPLYLIKKFNDDIVVKYGVDSVVELTKNNITNMNDFDNLFGEDANLVIAYFSALSGYKDVCYTYSKKFIVDIIDILYKNQDKIVKRISNNTLDIVHEGIVSVYDIERHDNRLVSLYELDVISESENFKERLSDIGLDLNYIDANFLNCNSFSLLHGFERNVENLLVPFFNSVHRDKIKIRFIQEYSKELVNIWNYKVDERGKSINDTKGIDFNNSLYII